MGKPLPFIVLRERKRERFNTRISNKNFSALNRGFFLSSPPPVCDPILNTGIFNENFSALSRGFPFSSPVCDPILHFSIICVVIGSRGSVRKL